MTQHRNRLHTIRLLRSAAVAFLAIGLGVTAVHAQGTNGQFPDPVTSKDLDQVALRLGLSPQQRQAIDMAHSEYRTAFAALREGDIEKYLQDQTNNARNSGRLGVNLDRDQVEKTTRTYNQIAQKIERLDEQFFDQLQPVLTEQQLELMPRIRMARARDRYDTGPARFTRFVNPGSRIDLSELFRNLKLSPDELADLDPLVAQYERDLTAAMRKYSSDAREQQLDMLKRVEAAGITEDAMNDRRAARRAMQTVRELWEENNRKMAEESARISELNKRTFRTLAELLPAEQSRQFRSSYINQAYGEAAPVIGRAEREIIDALEIEELPDELRAQIEDFRVATVHEMDRLTDGLVRLLDENRSTQSLFSFDPEGREEFEKEMSELRVTRDNANEQAIETLHAMLGEEYTANLRDADALLNEVAATGATLQAAFIALDGGGGGLQTITLSLSGDVALLGDSEHAALHIDPYIPQAISGRDVHRYAQLLEVDETMQPVLDALHADYQEQFKLIEGAEIKQVRDAQQNLWQFDPETHQTTAPEEGDIERLYRLRRRALDMIRVLDTSFFDDVELAFVTGENSAMMTRIRLHRERQMYNRDGSSDLLMPGGMALNRIAYAGGSEGYSFSFGGSGSNEATVDLAKIVSELELNETQRTAIDGIMATYEASAAETFRRAFEAGMAVQEEQDKRMAEQTHAQARGNGGDVFRVFNPAEAGGAQRQAQQKAKQDMANLNRRTLSDLMARLDPEAGQALEEAYNKQAFPEAFMDHRDVEARLTAALALDDLTSRQQQDLMDLSLTHRAEYRDLTDQMIEVIKATPSTGENRFEGIQQRMQSMERIRFTRNDLNDRSLAHMRTILNEDQMERLGGDDSNNVQFIEGGWSFPGQAIQIRR